MEETRLDINIQIKREGKSKMVAHARETTIDVIAYYAREERYNKVSYWQYLQYNAMRVAHKFTNDLGTMSIGYYYQIRDAIESMLKMLHEYSNVTACSVDITVYVPNYKEM